MLQQIMQEAPSFTHSCKLFQWTYCKCTDFLPDTVDFSFISGFKRSIHKVDLSWFLKCFKLLLWYVSYVLYNCYILCICVLPYSFFLFFSQRPPQELVWAWCVLFNIHVFNLHCCIFVFEQIKWWWWTMIIAYLVRSAAKSCRL